MNAIIETDRLLLRTFTENDAPLLSELNLDPEVTRYTCDPMGGSMLKRFCRKSPQYTLYNHGCWAGHLKANLEFTGWCGLKCRPEPRLTGLRRPNPPQAETARGQGNEIDPGYRFMKKFRGQGYATESAFACLQYGFTRLNIRLIIGGALPANPASIMVLEKCGMQYVGEEYIDGYLHKTYQATNPAIQL